VEQFECIRREHREEEVSIFNSAEVTYGEEVIPSVLERFGQNFFLANREWWPPLLLSGSKSFFASGGLSFGGSLLNPPPVAASSNLKGN
jgi:hypothetical protein